MGGRRALELVAACAAVGAVAPAADRRGAPAACDNYALAGGSHHVAKFSASRGVPTFVVLDSDGSFNHRLVALTLGVDDDVVVDSGSSNGTGADKAATRHSGIHSGSAHLFPIAGDWFGDGSGFDGVGLYDAATGTFHLKAHLSSGPPDVSFRFGHVDTTARPIAGRWEGGAGPTQVGLYYGSTGTVVLRLHPPPPPPPPQRRNFRGQGAADAAAAAAANITYLFGPPGSGWWPVVGEWTGSPGGASTIGLFDPASSKFYLRFANAAGPADATFQFGGPNLGALPVAGRWAGAKAPHAGVGIFVGGGEFELEHNLTGGSADLGYEIANPGTVYDVSAGAPAPWLPVAGRWRPSRCRGFDDGTSAPNPPAWAEGAVFYQLRVEMFTPDGTFDAAVPRLGYVASLGVTAIVLLPVAEARVPGAPVTKRTIFYGVRRPDVVDATLGGGAGLRRFVAACHALGMKVLVDNVPNGIRRDSPYLPTSPSFCGGADVTRRNATGGWVIAWGSNVELDWTAPELIAWWTERIAVAWVRDYDVDGFRCDCEPHYGNAPLWSRVTAEVLQSTGKRVLIMSEATPVWDTPASRSYAFDISQHDYDSIRFNPGLPVVNDFYFGTRPLADAVRSCGEPHATRTLTNHDYPVYVVHGRFSAFVYGAAVSPFAPHWFTGEEFNQTLNLLAGGTGVLYFQIQDWAALDDPPRRALADAVANVMGVRRRFLHVLRPPPGRPINATDVAMLPHDASTTDLPPYLLYSRAAQQAIFVLALRDRDAGDVVVTSFPGLAAMLGVTNSTTLTVVELLSNTTAVPATPAGALAASGFSARVEAGGVLVFLVEPARRHRRLHGAW